MKINEVLRLKAGTKVQCGNIIYTVLEESGYKLLSKDVTSVVNTIMYASLEVVEAEYELVRKKLTFFEAMKLADEGKIVESCSKFQYKKSNSKLVMINPTEGSAKTRYLGTDEMSNCWYEVAQ